MCKLLANVIDVSVPAVAKIPCFNNTLVVAKNRKGGAQLNNMEKSKGEELKANCFSPPDIMAISIPPCSKCPDVPVFLYINSDTNG